MSNKTGCSTPINNITLKDLKFTRQLAGAEDIKFGFGSLSQIRNGQVVIISEVNADTIPYDTADSVKTVIDKIIAKYPL